ncbi:MAG: prepilin-type N-terminal cleavage/methylation domain-containing protein, partial [Candidatus Paceibacterota bacterium]
MSLYGNIDKSDNKIKLQCPMFNIQEHNVKNKKSFTLVELMIVIAILAILSAIVIFALNPGRLFDNFRDTRRVSDISTIHK